MLTSNLTPCFPLAPHSPPLVDGDDLATGANIGKKKLLCNKMASFRC